MGDGKLECTLRLKDGIQPEQIRESVQLAIELANVCEASGDPSGKELIGFFLLHRVYENEMPDIQLFFEEDEVSGEAYFVLELDNTHTISISEDDLNDEMREEVYNSVVAVGNERERIPRSTAPVSMAPDEVRSFVKLFVQTTADYKDLNLHDIFIRYAALTKREELGAYVRNLFSTK